MSSTARRPAARSRRAISRDQLVTPPTLKLAGLAKAMAGAVEAVDVGPALAARLGRVPRPVRGEVVPAVGDDVDLVSRLGERAADVGRVSTDPAAMEGGVLEGHDTDLHGGAMPPGGDRPACSEAPDECAGQDAC